MPNSKNDQSLVTIVEDKLKPILIITYYWPPSGGAGVQRWLKFAKYLPEFGWDPIIFTPENPDFDQKDLSLEKDINPSVEVLKFPIWEPYGLFKRLTGKSELKQGQVLESGSGGFFKKFAIWIRGNLFVPDPKIFWVKPSADYLMSILETNEVKHIITTGPPHSIHLIGKRLKLRNPALTWVADFRDPWSQWDILKRMKISPFIWKKHLKLEQEVLKMSDAILATGPGAAAEFKALGARITHFITNGFDSSDIQFDQNFDVSSNFVISHLGMLSKHRNPENLWKALHELCEVDDFHDHLELRFTGILSSEVEASILSYPRLKDKLVTRTSVSHDKVHQEYLSSSLLLLLQTNNERSVSQLPGKLFEYLSAKRPILAIGVEGNDITKIISDCSAGDSFDYNSDTELKEFLLQEYATWKSSASRWKFERIDRYERKNLTQELSEWLKSL